MGDDGFLELCNDEGKVDRTRRISLQLGWEREKKHVPS